MDWTPPFDPDLAALGRDGGLLTIDLDAIRANFRLLRDRVPACAGVVKADGYGLGAAPVIGALAREGCRYFFVAHLSEAIALRHVCPRDGMIIVLHGPTPGAEAEFAANGIVPVLNTPQQVAAWSALAASRGQRLQALLQIDTGMTRFGVSPGDLGGLSLDGIEVLFVMSHLACADTPDDPANAVQLDCFRRYRLPGVNASLAASSGIFLGADYHFDLVRPGAALYGVSPVPGPNPMRAVVRLQGLVVQTREVPEGTAVGYGHTARTARASLLATVAVGYADGFLRSGSNAACAWLGDTRLPLMGRVSMDSIVLDATDAAGRIAPGTLVDLIGPHHGLDAAAACAGTIGYEMLTSLGHRYARRYLKDS